MFWLVILIAVLVLLALLMAIYFIYQPYSLYNTVKKPGYRRNIIWEGTDQVTVETPYLLSDKAFGVDLSLVIPCYNESTRFPPCFDETYQYLQNLKERENTNIEIVLVNDGSKDTTWDMIKGYCTKYKDDPVVTVRGVSVNPNSGKGNAVRIGFLYTKGDYVLMLDADGATEISDYERLKSWMKDHLKEDNQCIAIGSRKLKIEGVESQVKRTCLRNFVSKVFNLLTRIMIGTNILDTQCGFKLFTRRSARIVCIQHLERWSFDTELLFIAAQKSIPVVEVPVNWHEVLGEAKISVFKDSLKMLRDLIAIRVLYGLGFWKLSDSLTRQPPILRIS